MRTFNLPDAAIMTVHWRLDAFVKQIEVVLADSILLILIAEDRERPRWRLREAGI